MQTTTDKISKTVELKLRRILGTKPVVKDVDISNEEKPYLFIKYQIFLLLIQNMWKYSHSQYYISDACISLLTLSLSIFSILSL